MAIVQVGELISSIRGSVGGVTFRNSKSGIVALSRPIGHKATTQKGYISRNNLQDLIIGYRELGNDSKDNWIEYADLYTKVNMFGNTRILSGFNWFTSMNYYREFCGLSVFVNPPVHVLPTAVPEWTVTNEEDGININIGEMEIVGDEYFIWYISNVYNLDSTALTSQLRIGGFQLTEQEISINITEDFDSITGLVYSDIVSTGIFNIGVGLRVFNGTSGIITAIDRKVLSVG